MCFLFRVQLRRDRELSLVFDFSDVTFNRTFGAEF